MTTVHDETTGPTARSHTRSSWRAGAHRDPDPTDGPFAGVKVLDLTRVLMGPLCTQVLADQGADVILVEANGGDTNRVMGPGPHPELSGIALNVLRNKRSVDLDLKSETGRRALHELVRGCDVVVTSMRPEPVTRLGLDYATLSRIRPDLVYCQAQGFALSSPRANEPAYDDVIQAAGGVADIMQRVFGEPALLPTAIADKVCGLVMAQAVSAALFQHERTGLGAHIEVAMDDAFHAFMLAEHGGGGVAEPPVHQGSQPAAGYPRLLSPERRPHRTKDGLVHLFPYRPQHYADLFAEAGLDNQPHRYVDQRATLVHSDSLYQDVRSIAPRRTTAEWLEYCRTAGIPATRVATLQDLLDDLPLAEHPAAGTYRVIPEFAQFSTQVHRAPRPAPLIGEQTAQVLADLGLLEVDDERGTAS